MEPRRLWGCHLRCSVVVEVEAAEEHDPDLKPDVLEEAEVVEALNSEEDSLVVEDLVEEVVEVLQGLYLCDSCQRRFALPLPPGWALCGHSIVGLVEVEEVPEVFDCTCKDRIRYRRH